jgi:hypothetical protein
LKSGLISGISLQQSRRQLLTKSGQSRLSSFGLNPFDPSGQLKTHSKISLVERPSQLPKGRAVDVTGGRNEDAGPGDRLVLTFRDAIAHFKASILGNDVHYKVG